MRPSLARSARTGLALAVDLLLPRFCLGCSRRLPPEGAPLLLCPICRGQLVRVDRRRSCALCARELGGESRPGRRCPACLVDPPPFAPLVAVWRYAPPLDRVVRAMKLGRLDFLAAALVEEALGSGAAPPAGALVAVPMPLLRKLGRGFNQAERIAAELAGRTGAPRADALARGGLLARPQRRLAGRARRGRPELRFRPRRAHLPGPGSAAVLVDDVVTTGATLRAAARALGRVAAGPISAWVLAATPPPDARNGGRAPGDAP